jgi:glycine/D-amino acid oxidase-like deaminating enzyme/nitrite reductase/ring-hydroxylating ferredoxin subunit
MVAKGPNIPLWLETSKETSYRPLGDKPPAFDAVVLGAGIAGLTTALLLKHEGLKVAVLEMDRVATGVTGHTTAKITALHGLVYSELLSKHGEDRTAAYAEANSSAIDRIIALSEIEDIDCDLQRLDAYTYAETEDGLDAVRKEAEACDTVGLKAEVTTDVPLPFETLGAVRLGEQAAFHPHKYCAGLAAAINGGGSRVYERTRVLDVEEKKRVCRVKTERGSISAKWVVVATHLPFMGDGSFYAKTHPVRSYALAVKTPAPPDGMFISAEDPIRSIRPVAAGRRRWAIVGGESHKVGQDPDTEARYRALEGWAKDRLGASDPDHRWSAQDYVSMDGMPYVGHLTSDRERTFVATGFRKWGMTNATAAGMMISDEILGRENPWAFAFDATRVRPKQAAKDFVKENLNVAKELVEGKLMGPTTTLDRIDPGTAAFVQIGGELVGVYLDEKRKLHAVSTECTHMRCRLGWNRAERSWDCPCHGSRFDPDGHVLQGPANKDLKQKKLPQTAKPRSR